MSVAPGSMMPPEEAAATMQQEQMAQVEAIAASAPQPEKPYSTKLIKKVADEVNKLIDKVDKEMADIEYEAEGSKHDGPLPAEVFVPLVLVLGFGAQFGGEKFQMDPATLVNDAALRKAHSLVKMMSKDKELIAKMKDPAAGEEEKKEEAAPPPEPMPGQEGAMDKED